MWIYDCEVFKKDWMFVFIEVETNQREYIINDAEKLKSFYEEHADEIVAGYNSRGYDQYIMKAILIGKNPKKVNDYIIESGMHGATFDKGFNKIEILNYDCQIDKLKSLKQLEGFMGNDIRETSVPFNIDRKLTEEELDAVLKYCIHDVEQTLLVFQKQISEFESHMSLVKAFDLPNNYLNKTKAQLSAIIIGAENNEMRNDEFDITIPDTFIISDKYKYILNWYKTPINMNYKMALKTKVMGVPHILAWGGIHGSIDGYNGTGFYVMSDVASLYPSIMLEYNCLSRNVSNPDKYRQIRDTRMEMKRAKNPIQLPYKIVLNSTYGAMKDKYNQLYDPLMANNVCITGQLLLLDLIDKIEIEFGNECELVQSNTDGILVKLQSEAEYERYVKVCDEWCARTRLDLEHDIYTKVIQKDVNNYIIVDAKGKYKSKGAYVKKLNDLDYDLPIINRALINKMVHDIPIETTITECDKLKDFQKIVKLSGIYKHAFHGDRQLDEKVQRIFADNTEDGKGLFKVKGETLEKIGNTPEKCFIYNDDVNDLSVPANLDRQWYIDVANKRLEDFLEPPVDDGLIDISELITHPYENFIDLLRDIKIKTPTKPKEIVMLINMNYFSSFGSIKKLTSILELEKKLTGKKKLEREKLEPLGISLDMALKFGRATVKSIMDLDSTGLLNYMISILPNDEYSISEIVKLQIESCGRVNYTSEELDKRYSVVRYIDSKDNHTLYCLQNGREMTVRISKQTLAQAPLEVGDIVYGSSFQKLPKSKYVGRDDKGKPKYENIKGVFEWWLQRYHVINEL